MAIALSDKTLVCRECGNTFVWTAGESPEHARHRLSSCGRPGQVPFAPRTDKPVYCSDCFETRRAAPRPV